VQFFKIFASSINEICVFLRIIETPFKSQTRCTFQHNYIRRYATKLTRENTILYLVIHLVNLSMPSTNDVIIIIIIYLFNYNLATGGSLTDAILSCHVEL